MPLANRQSAFWVTSSATEASVLTRRDCAAYKSGRVRTTRTRPGVSWGYATYYRKFIKDFAHIVELLNKFLQKGRQFYWSPECEKSFKTIKAAFADTITLVYPDFSKPFIVDCDASDFGIGGVLSQVVKPGLEQPVSYFSRTLSKPERKYAVTRREMLALVESLRHFRCYILGYKFKVRTDHSALQWLRALKEPVDQVARWIERLI